MSTGEQAQFRNVNLVATRSGFVASNQMVGAVADAGLLGRDDQSELRLIEKLEPFVPFDQFAASGILWAFGAILILIGDLVKDDHQERLDT